MEEVCHASGHARRRQMPRNPPSPCCWGAGPPSGRSSRLDPGRRNFHAVWPSLFATSMGLMAFLPVLALYVQERFGIDDPKELAFWAGLIYGTAPLTAAVLGPVWGGLGDRLGKKPMAIRANVAIALTTALMPLAPTPVVLLLMRAVQGAFAGYVAPAMALVSQGVPREQHGRVIAQMQVAMASGAFLGPYIGAEVTHWWGRSSLFWITSVLSCLAALQLWLFAREGPPRAPVAGSTFAGELWQSSKALLANRVFAWLLLLVLVLRLGQNMLEPFIALFVRELGPQQRIRHWSDTEALALDRTIAIAFAVLAVAQWVFTPWWGRLADRRGPLRCLAGLSACLAVVSLATSFVQTIDQFLLVRCLAAALMAGSMTLAYAAASKRVEDERRTLSFSMMQSCMQLGFALGPLIGAAAAGFGGEGTNFRRSFVVAGALCLVAAIGMGLLRRHGTAAGSVV
ncbi:MAG: MFS transporter [Planctomycetota bacterium]